MNTQSKHQREESPPSVIEGKKYAAPGASSEIGPSRAADYVYRIAAVTIGIFLLATVV
jgi:hypothetical protein